MDMTDMPAWARLKNELAEEIRSGRRRPGDRIPPERHLAAVTGLSVGTVRRALEALVREGFCYRAQGRGTFVTSPPADRAVFFRMSSSLLDESPFDIIPTAIERTAEVPPDDIRAAMEIEEVTQCIRIRRVLHGRRVPSSSLGEKGPEASPLAAGTPEPGRPIPPAPLPELFLLGVCDSWFSPVLCRRLAGLPLDEFRGRSIYTLLREECGHAMAICDEWISLAPSMPREFPHAAEAGLDEPCIVMHMLSRTSDHQPLEYRTSHVAAHGRGLLRRHQPC